jgi:hypothetical protein
MLMPGTVQTLESSNGQAMAASWNRFRSDGRASEQNNRRAVRVPDGMAATLPGAQAYLQMALNPGNEPSSVAQVPCKACKGRRPRPSRVRDKLVGSRPLQQSTWHRSLIGLFACASYRRRSRQHGSCVVCWRLTWQRVFLVPEGCLQLTVGLVLSRILPPHLRRVASRCFLSPSDQPSFLGLVFVNVFFNRDQMGFGSSDRRDTPCTDRALGPGLPIVQRRSSRMPSPADSHGRCQKL